MTKATSAVSNGFHQWVVPTLRLRSIRNASTILLTELLKRRGPDHVCFQGALPSAVRTNAPPSGRGVSAVATTHGMGRRLYLPLIALSLLVAGSSACQRTCGPAVAHADVDSAAAAIQSLATEWFKAIAAKDLEKTLSFYAPEAQYLSGGRPAASTPEERRKLWVEDYATPGFSSEEATAMIEVAQSGELAYQRGTYFSKAQIDQQKMNVTTGKFLVIWRKQSSGEWKAIIDIDNADQ